MSTKPNCTGLGVAVLRDTYRDYLQARKQFEMACEQAVVPQDLPALRDATKTLLTSVQSFSLACRAAKETEAHRGGA